MSCSRIYVGPLKQRYVGILRNAWICERADVGWSFGLPQRSMVPFTVTILKVKVLPEQDLAGAILDLGRRVCTGWIYSFLGRGAEVECCPFCTHKSFESNGIAVWFSRHLHWTFGCKIVARSRGTRKTFRHLSDWCQESCLIDFYTIFYRIPIDIDDKDK